MPGSYLPQQDGPLNDWLTNFSTLITATPTTYGLVAADATQIALYVNQYSDALATATDPGTRTKPTIAAKDAAKAAVGVVVRPYAQQVRNNLGVSNMDKVTLGLTIPSTTKTPIPAPSSQPILEIIGATPGVLTLRYADANTPDKRAKPFGTLALEVFVGVATAAITDPLAADFYGLATKQPFAINFVSGQNGKTATVFGRWVTRTGLVGPWSAASSFTIVA